MMVDNSLVGADEVGQQGCARDESAGVGAWRCCEPTIIWFTVACMLPPDAAA